MAHVSTLSVDAALNAYKGKSLPELTKSAAEITKIDSDNSIMRRVQSICYNVGVACKAKGLKDKPTAEAVKTAFETFCSGWYYKGAGGKREPLKATSKSAMLSALQAYGSAGLKPYNTVPLIVAVMSMEAAPLSQRGGKVRKIIDNDAFTKANPPTAKDIAKAIKGGGKSRTGGRKAPALLASLCAMLEERAVDETIADFAKGDKVIGANLRSIWAAAAGIREQLSTTLNAEKKAEYRKGSTILKKAAAALPQHA